MKKNYLILGLLAILTIGVLAACGGNEESAPSNNSNSEMETSENNENANNDESNESSNHDEMDPSSSGEVPDELEDAESPKYEEGSKAIIETDHMAGMKGAEATIDGAYDTVAYTVSYTPTDGGDPVEDHKWVIHEELENPDEAPLEPGTEVTMNASHMEGMDGATAEIDSANETVVYMVSYTSTDDNEEVSNHKWVTEDELSPVE